MRLLCLSLLTAAAAAAPLTPEKLQLIPGLYPKERRELARKLQPLMGREEGVTEALRLAGVDENVAQRLQELYPGPLLVERYAHGLVLEAPYLTERQRALFEHLHPSVLAAQWALWGQRRRLETDEGLKQDEVLRRRLAGDFDRQIREMEKRYWRIVGYALTVAQRAALHELMPQPYRRPPNVQGHVFMLPGLTPSQASRIRALITEYESETAADTAELQRLRADRELAAAERQRRSEAATDRVAEVLRGIVERSREIITPAQMEHLDALPPLLSPGERRQNPGDFLQRMGLMPEQQQRLQALVAGVQKKVQAAHERARGKLAGMEGELGAEAPQAMTMQMMRQDVDTTRILALEEAARTAVLEILDPKQILGWIITPR
ncbi:MAG: hypothetical protein ACYTEZ_11340 [Planctomycetota bacterium]|jgi:hypothetical protein